MAEDSNRIGISRIASGLDQIRKSSGVGAISSADTGSVTGGSGNPTYGPMGGPRGNRVLPADYPLDQLDRKAARGTYLDILV